MTCRSQQFLQGRQNCSLDNCRDQPAFGAYRGGVYGDEVRASRDEGTGALVVCLINVSIVIG